MLLNNGLLLHFDTHTIPPTVFLILKLAFARLSSPCLSYATLLFEQKTEVQENYIRRGQSMLQAIRYQRQIITIGEVVASSTTYSQHHSQDPFKSWFIKTSSGLADCTNTTLSWKNCYRSPISSEPWRHKEQVCRAFLSQQKVHKNESFFLHVFKQKVARCSHRNEHNS